MAYLSFVTCSCCSVVITAAAYVLFAWRFLNGLSYFVRYWLSILRPVDLKRYGGWAIITGGSDGIGRGYAYELAKRGLNVCLIARKEDKLKAVCESIQAKYKVKTEYIAFDFSTDDFNDLSVKINEFPWVKDIGVLINNVGILPYAYDSYEERSRDFDDLQRKTQQSYEVNIRSQGLMTGIVLPILCEKKRGAIVNLSSVSAVEPTCYWTIYSSSKAYNYFFARSISQELNYDYPDIVCQVVQPCVVITNMAPKFVKESLRFPTTETFCKYAVSTIGWLDETSGYWFHDLLAMAQRIPGYGRYLTRGRYVKIHQSRARKAAQNAAKKTE